MDTLHGMLMWTRKTKLPQSVQFATNVEIVVRELWHYPRNEFDAKRQEILDELERLRVDVHIPTFEEVNSLYLSGYFPEDASY
jgi:hypothetical protein